MLLCKIDRMKMNQKRQRRQTVQQNLKSKKAKRVARMMLCVMCTCDLTVWLQRAVIISKRLNATEYRLLSVSNTTASRLRFYTSSSPILSYKWIASHSSVCQFGVICSTWDWLVVSNENFNNLIISFPCNNAKNEVSRDELKFEI